MRKKDFYAFRIPAFSPARMMTVWLKVQWREQWTAAQRAVMVVDMQNGVFATPRLARSAASRKLIVRRAADKVIFIQHDLKPTASKPAAKALPCFLSWSSRLARCMSPKPPGCLLSHLAGAGAGRTRHSAVRHPRLRHRLLPSIPPLKMAPAAGTVLLSRKMPTPPPTAPPRRPRRLSPTTMRCGVR